MPPLRDELPEEPAGNALPVPDTQIAGDGGRIIQMTAPRTRNPYFAMFADTFSAIRGPVLHSTSIEDALSMTYAMREKVTVWFHQLEPFYHPSGERGDDAPSSADRLIEGLHRLRRAGATLVHTWHNRFPHDKRHMLTDVAVYSRLADVFDLVITHCADAESWARRWIGATPTVVVPHPALPAKISPYACTDESSRNTAVDFVTFGEFKSYKALWRVVEAWRRFQATDNLSTSCRLLLLGENSDRLLAVGKIRKIPGLKWDMARYRERDLDRALRSAQFSVFSHYDVWTSGAAIASLSRGVPVILPCRSARAIGVRDSLDGITFDEGSINSLAAAFGRAARDQDSGRTRAYAVDWARRHAMKSMAHEYQNALLYHGA
jgi:glycosyltransferase involved in cell wall biosynthesis